MKLLLHACCAPCSIQCIKDLRSEGIDFHLFWYNPNIHPYTEYAERRDSLALFAANERLDITLADEYGLRFFLQEISQAQERCEKCYRLRLERAASFAAREGFSLFSTTLLISPYQDHDAIKRIGEEAGEKYGVDFFYRDFRIFFREGQSAARAEGLYMQKYCGCIFSEEERYLRKNPARNENKKKEESVYEQNPAFDRLSLLISDEGLEKLKKTSVLVFGAGGVGSWAAEALVRSGIVKIGIIDHDTVCPSNINRQIEATTATIGLPKVIALKERLLQINPSCEITSREELFCSENKSSFGIENTCYVIDAIDSINHKLTLIETACGAGVTLFSSMGMALKIDPSQIKTASIWNTKECPLARLVRQGLRKKGFSSDFTVVYSTEHPVRPGFVSFSGQKQINGSIVTVTASAGLLLASLVINDVIGNK